MSETADPGPNIIPRPGRRRTRAGYVPGRSVQNCTPVMSQCVASRTQSRSALAVIEQPAEPRLPPYTADRSERRRARDQPVLESLMIPFPVRRKPSSAALNVRATWRMKCSSGCGVEPSEWHRHVGQPEYEHSRGVARIDVSQTSGARSM